MTCGLFWLIPASKLAGLEWHHHSERELLCNMQINVCKHQMKNCRQIRDSDHSMSGSRKKGNRFLKRSQVCVWGGHSTPHHRQEDGMNGSMTPIRSSSSLILRPLTCPWCVVVGVYILIAAGALMMVVGFLGCCGAIRESPCMLGLVSKIFFFVCVCVAGADFDKAVLQHHLKTRAL